MRGDATRGTHASRSRRCVDGRAVGVRIVKLADSGPQQQLPTTAEHPSLSSSVMARPGSDSHT